MKKFGNKTGYTIIETMIAISIFLAVVVSGVSTLLQANIVHQKSEDMRSITDNLSFIIEEISRDLRTGTNYRCVTGAFSSSNIDVPQNCSSGGAIAFEYTFGDTASDTDQWVYKIESTNGGATFNLSKSTNSGTSWVQLNPSEVSFSSVSGFSVLGAPEPPGDSQQPLVFIRLVGSINYKGVTSPFSLQTTVSQRLVDL